MRPLLSVRFRNLRLSTLFGVLLALALILAACPAEEQPDEDEAAEPADDGEDIRIGFVAGLTGDEAPFGTPFLDGVDMAVDEINEQGGIDGRQVVVVTEDSESRASAGVDATQKLITADSVDVVVHASFSGVFFPSVEYAMGQDVPVVNAGSSSPDIRDLDDGAVVTMLALDDTVAQALAEWAYSDGLTTAGIVVGNDPYGLGVRDSVTTHFQELGGEIVGEAVVEAAEPDYRPELGTIADDDPDVIFSATFADDARLQFRQLGELGVDAPWYVLYPTIMGFADFEPAWDRLFGLEIGWLEEEASDWRERFEARTGSEPDTPWPSIGYDAIWLSAMAVSDSDGTPLGFAEAAAEIGPTMDGPSGSYTLDEDFTRIDSPFQRLVLRDGEFQPAE